MTTKKCKCSNCSKDYEINLNEYNRKIKINTPFYCSRECASKVNINKSNKIKKWRTSLQNKKHIKKYSNNRLDEFSMFRPILKRAKQRKHQEFNINLKDLKKIWDTQKGKCYILGHDLILPDDKQIINHNFLASLDRIDNSKGYIKNNVRFVCATINYAKNKFDDIFLKEFILLCSKSV